MITWVTVYEDAAEVITLGREVERLATLYGTEDHPDVAAAIAAFLSAAEDVGDEAAKVAATA